MKDLVKLENESTDNLEYINDVDIKYHQHKKYCRDYLNNSLAKTNDPVKQQEILELLKEYV